MFLAILDVQDDISSEHNSAGYGLLFQFLRFCPQLMLMLRIAYLQSRAIFSDFFDDGGSLVVHLFEFRFNGPNGNPWVSHLPALPIFVVHEPR